MRNITIDTSNAVQSADNLMEQLDWLRRMVVKDRDKDDLLCAISNAIEDTSDLAIEIANLEDDD